ncbi:MAG: 2-oxo acid dehydrogenase subunit E2 [Verrucomicrobia bacterium]|nr:2-oxo acid dehydrogenase subunit E2 [Verrucomicrobiota bacterium]
MDVKLPKLGEGADSGSVVSILVQEGDLVKKGQTVIELENEKAVAPIPATASGVIANIRVKEGDKISVGQIILSIVEASASSAPVAETNTPTFAPAAPKAKRAAPAPEPEPAPSIADESVDNEHEVVEGTPGIAPAAAPSIRKIARELGIDLRRIRGSEDGGRIVMADLRAYVQRLQKLTAQPKPAAPPVPPAAKSVAESIDFSQWGAVTKKPLTPLRKTISRRMTENWNTIPHVTQFDEADVTALLELRKKYAAAYDGKGAHLTLTTFALKAVVTALKKFPIFNASLDEATQEIVFKEYFHIGIAVDTDAGLIVPVIRNVDKKNLVELSKELSAVAEKARDRKIGLEDLKGGTFTISNQGGIGGAHFTPIVNKPELAILGLGRGAVKAVVRDKQIVVRTMLPIAISYDHRLIDGGTAARFTIELVNALENFAEAEIKI